MSVTTHVATGVKSMNTVIRKIGNSEGVIIPKDILESLGLSAGDDIVLLKDGAELRIRPMDESCPRAHEEVRGRAARTRQMILHDREIVEALHAEQLALHGGAPGLRDEGMLESALNRSLQKLAYSEPDIFELAAAYLLGIVKKHPFIDGNKRTGYLAADVFLALNGWSVEAGQEDIITFVLAVASGEIDEVGAAMFFRDYCQKIEAAPV
jgi:death on curing protein